MKASGISLTESVCALWIAMMALRQDFSVERRAAVSGLAVGWLPGGLFEVLPLVMWAS